MLQISHLLAIKNTSFKMKIKSSIGQIIFYHNIY
nr:MAG TPA: hypothetical protein [Caudoviricetes sp.]